MRDNIEIICFESEAFFKLLAEVIERLKPVKEPLPDKWVSGQEAMRLLRIKSKTTLQKLRDEGRIRFSQPDKKTILYDTVSINDYLEDFVYETFSAVKSKKKVSR
jgi:hypothetical protein